MVIKLRESEKNATEQQTYRIDFVVASHIENVSVSLFSAGATFSFFNFSSRLTHIQN